MMNKYSKFQNNAVVIIIFVTGIASTLATSQASPGTVRPPTPLITIDFTIEPNLICQGDKVNLEWNVAGPANTLIKLKAAPGFDNLLNELTVRDEGIMELEIGETTTFTLTAESGGSFDGAEKTVEIVPSEGKILTWRTEGECVDGEPTWLVNASTELFSPQLMVEYVSNKTGREITVTHNGVSETIEAMGTTDVFNGQSLIGEWHIKPVLMDGEDCVMDSTGSLPFLPPVTIEVKVKCP